MPQQQQKQQKAFVLIKVKPETRQLLGGIGTHDETFDQIIRKLINEHVSKQQ